MVFVNTSGKRMHYVSSGKGLPVMFIHGSMGSHRTWDKQRMLADEYHLIMVDLPGHGKSDSLDEVSSVKLFADNIVEQVRSLELGKIVAVGHSLGGAICIQLGLDFPEFLHALVLVGTGAKLGVLPVILASLQTHYEEAIELAIGGMAFAEKADPVLIEQTKIECLKCTSEVAYADFLACNNFDVRERISEISVPTFIVVGREDKLTPLKWSQYLKKTIRDSTLLVIENAGHMVMLEQPEDFNRGVRSFLSNLMSSK